MVDKVRASRDGHEYHEIWTARRALSLILPSEGLSGIAIEGLSVEDESEVSDTAIEVADLTIYYGKGSHFSSCTSMVIQQFKYSVASANKNFRASDTKKTIKKFTQAEKDYLAKQSKVEVIKKLSYELVTNRPILPELQDAINCLANDTTTDDIVTNEQIKQIKDASVLNGKKLQHFCQRLLMTGTGISLKSAQTNLRKTITSWAADEDIQAKALLGDLKQMVRDKAGTDGERNHIITKYDVMESLGIDDFETLLPCQSAIIPLETSVLREQTSQALSKIKETQLPVLIHATGGIGKTVFLQSIVNELSHANHIVLFDCFGGGDYRTPSDRRHLYSNGLLHIINELALSGLCAPILPNTSEESQFLRAVKKRLRAAIQQLRLNEPEKNLVICLDAADNSSIGAAERNEQPFPILLIKSLAGDQSIDGLTLILTCRTERIEMTIGDVPCLQFPLLPFTKEETKLYCKIHKLELSDTKVGIAHDRSGGNPRVLDYLRKTDQLLHSSRLSDTPNVEEILEKIVADSIQQAITNGILKEQVDLFLTAIVVLPPPIPINELAQALSITTSAIESFSAEFTPLIENTALGLVFRDEPAETYLCSLYGKNETIIKNLVKNLHDAQTSSKYMATILPLLLQKTGLTDALYQLAFSKKLPDNVTSDAGKRRIILMRIKAALYAAVQKQNYNHIVSLLVEYAMISGADDKGLAYLSSNPDLIHIANDTDSIRRIFETKELLPFAKYSSRCILATLGNDISTSRSNAIEFEGWLDHERQKIQDHKRKHATANEIAAIPFFLASSKDHLTYVSEYFKHWNPLFAFKIAKYFTNLLRLKYSTCTTNEIEFDVLIKAITSESSTSWVLTTALIEGLSKIDQRTEKDLLTSLSSFLPTESIHENSMSDTHTTTPSIMLLYTAGRAVRHKLPNVARKLTEACYMSRPHELYFERHYTDTTLLNWLLQITIQASYKSIPPKLIDLLPKDFYEVLPKENHIMDDAELRVELLKWIKLTPIDDSESFKTKKHFKTSREQHDGIRLIEEKLDHLLILVKAGAQTLTASKKNYLNASASLLDLWAQLRKVTGQYGQAENELTWFYEEISRKYTFQILRICNDWSTSSVKQLINCYEGSSYVSPSSYSALIKELSCIKEFHLLAGQLAKKAISVAIAESDTDKRTDEFAEISRAIQSASKDEATAYYKQGLNETEAIGSGDYQFINDLLIFAQNLRAPLSDELAYRFGQICELNMQYDEEKFPWIATGYAFAKAAGPKVIAQYARWDDRDKILLDYNFDPLIVGLLENKSISSSQAVALLPFTKLGNYHDWKASEIIKHIIGQNPDDAPELIQTIIRYTPKSSPRTLQSVLKAIPDAYIHAIPNSEWLQKAPKTLQQCVDHDNGRRNNHSSPKSWKNDKKYIAEQKKEEARVNSIIEDIDPLNHESISNGILETGGTSSWYYIQDKLFPTLHDKVAYSDRMAYLNSLMAAEKIQIKDKITVCEELIQKWEISSTALSKTQLNTHLDSLIKQHCKEIVTTGYGIGSTIKELAKFGQTSMAKVAFAMLQQVVKQEIDVANHVLFDFASIIADLASPEIPKEVLTRILTSKAARRVDEIGDGVWGSHLAPSTDTEEIIAHFIWSKLASPQAKQRWEAAHSVRILAKFSNWSIIEKLISLISSPAPSAYLSPDHEFMFYNAKQWLLIALARISKNDPKNVSQFVTKILDATIRTTIPHVIIDHFVKCITVNCSDYIDLPDIDQKIIDKINQPSLPMKNKQEYYKKHSRIRKRKPYSPDSFRLGYHFEKDLEYGLESLFGISHDEFSDFLENELKDEFPNISSTNDLGGRGRHGNYMGGRQASYNSDCDIFGEYLANHKKYELMGRLIHERPILTYDFDNNPWQDWLDNRILTNKEGYWLSDGVDFQPADTHCSCLIFKDNAHMVITEIKAVLAVATIAQDLRKQEELTLEGNWQSYEGVQIFVSSVFTNSHDAETIAEQLLTIDDGFSIRLPQLQFHLDEYYEDSDELHIDVEPFIAEVSYEPALDEHDAFGSRSAQERSRPAIWFQKKLSLNSVDPFNREWLNPNKEIVIKAEAWGHHTGSGQHKKEINGNRLKGSTKHIQAYLQENKKSLISLIKLKRYDDSNEDAKFTFVLATVVRHPDLSVSISEVKKLMG